MPGFLFRFKHETEFVRKSKQTTTPPAIKPEVRH